MSINVTVTGNPVSIKRGKLITTDSDACKSEFDKRRRIRLEQVRQQSKEIAEDVRNRVRNVKSKQLSDIEQQGKDKLKQWQARKLLELQNQYRECLNDLGSAHKEASLIQKVDNISKLKKNVDVHKAKVRGEKAMQQVRDEVMDKQLEKALRSEQKKFVRDIENTRSHLVANLPKKKSPFKKRKKKTKANVNVTVESKGMSESENESDDVPEFVNISSGDSNSSTSSVKRKKRRKERSSTSSSLSDVYTPTPTHTNNSTTDEPFQETKTKSMNSYNSTDERAKPPFAEKKNIVEYPLSTKISEYIKNRTHKNPCPAYREDYGEEAVNKRHVIHSNPTTTSTTVIDENYLSKPKSSLDSAQCSKSHYDDYIKKTHSSMETAESSKSAKRKLYHRENEEPVHRILQDIPKKPTISLKSVKSKSTTEPQKSSRTATSHVSADKAQYYDHSNRFTKEYTGNAQVERIDKDSIEVCPSVGSEVEFHETMYRRDQEAELRGQKALEKERIHKDYKELMKKLPVLQRKERIATITSDKPVYHMSDDRLKEHERRKQNQMDNAYEHLFPSKKPPIITVPPKNHPKASSSNLPFETVDVDDTRTLNLASWDVDKSVGKAAFYTATKESLLEQNDQVISSNDKKSRRDKLTSILNNLIHQRNKVLEELNALPEGSNLNSLIDDLSTVGENQQQQSRKVTSCSNSDSESHRADKTRSQNFRPVYLSSSSVSDQPRVRTRVKSKQQLLVLQNESTQTSPKHLLKSELIHLPETAEKSVLTSPMPSSSPVKKTVTKIDKEKSKTTQKSSQSTSSKQLSTDSNHVNSCHCRSSVLAQNQTDSDKICEIVIKIRDNENEKEFIVSPTNQNQPIVITKSPNMKVKLPVAPEKTKPKKPDSPRKQIKMNVVTNDKPPRSWREHFSQNYSNNTTSSTSYMSPPDFTKTEHDGSKNRTNHFGDILYKRPQQTNVINSNSESSEYSGVSNKMQNLDPNLVKYIRKLLKMSRGSIENLAISTVSETSTPAQSVIEMSSNNSLGKLQNIMKHYNLELADLEKCLQYSSEESLTHYNTTESVTVSSSDGSQVTIQKSQSTDKLKAPLLQKQTNAKDIRQMTLEEYSQQNYPKIMTKYAQIAETCNKRISNLNDMIEKVRQEKQKIMNSANESGSDKENSTAYLNLPNLQNSAKQNTSEASSTSSGLEQEELNRKLLEVDYELAEKLKNLPPPTVSDDITDIDQDLLLRFKKLLDLNLSKPSNDNNKCDNFVTTTHQKETEVVASPEKSPRSDISDIPFVPLLLDIPKLPKLTIPGTVQTNQLHRRPPPAKGIITAKRFNNNITIVPHELSTIVEVDSQSQISNKVHRTTTSIRDDSLSSKKSDCTKELQPGADERFTVCKVPGPNRACAVINAPAITVNKKSSDDSMPDILINKRANGEHEQVKKQKDSIAKRVDNDSESSTEKSNENDNIEAMLRGMGMGWAIATIRKTQEALALTSSSSSLDFSSKKEEVRSDLSMSGEVSLKRVLEHKILKHINSGSSNEQLMSSSLLREFNDLSAIEGSSRNLDKNQHRTSTPILGTKSAEKTKSSSAQTNVLFTEESDLSSVKTISDKNS